MAKYTVSTIWDKGLVIKASYYLIENEHLNFYRWVGSPKEVYHHNRLEASYSPPAAELVASFFSWNMVRKNA